MKKILPIIALTALFGVANATVIFDDTGSPTLTSTSGMPRSIMGGAVTVANVTAPFKIKTIHFYPVFWAVANYTNVRLTFSFWNTVNTANFNTANPIFADLNGNTTWYVDYGPWDNTGAYYYDLAITMPDTMAPFPNNTIGIQVGVQVDTGSGLAYTNDVAQMVACGAPPTVGSNPFTNAFFRNASGFLNIGTSFLGTDARSFSGLTDATPMLKIETEDGQSLSGTATLGDFIGDASTVATKFELRDSGGTVVETWNQNLGANGAFTLVPTSTIPDGSYTLWVKSSHWLAATASVDVTSTGATGIEVTELNGDCDGDNSVTVFDYNALSDAFDSAPGDGNWNAMADLDGDGGVTVFDYNILSNNFDMVGDEF